MKNKYNRIYTKEWEERELSYKQFKFFVDFQEFWIRQWKIFVYSNFFQFWREEVMLTYKTDDFWWYETDDIAKAMVEEFIETVLNSNQKENA